jgi:succinoglycan biosynthesis transport protein ExoP
MARSQDLGSGLSEPASEIDLRALGAAIVRRKRAILIPTLLALILVTIFVNVVKPRYTAETQVLLENQETFFTRPDRVNLPAEQSSQVDQEAVASQVQLINSRDLARRAIKELHLEGNPEFDPMARGMGLMSRLLVLFGLAHDPSRDSIDARIVTAFLEKLTVYSPVKTRVISIQFTSRDPDLAERGANAVAELYLREQSAAKRSTANEAADALASQIADLRVKLAEADAKREQYRQQSGLLAGTNNMTISGQQLAEINTDLSRARSSQADAQAKASMIRQLLREGKAADVPEVLNNDIVRRISDQRVTAQAQLALESRTLLPGHPRIKELTAQVAQFDLSLKTAAKQAATTLENEAKIAGQRVLNLETVLNNQKKVAGLANTDEVTLRALERNAQSIKDQLESSTTKYQEALARQSSTATPADARIISRAATPQDPSYPKKMPFIIFGTVAAFVFSLGFVVAGELLGGTVAPQTKAPRTAPSHWDEPLDADPVMMKERPQAASPVPAGSQTSTAPQAPIEPDLVFAPVKPSPIPDRRLQHGRPKLGFTAGLPAAGLLGSIASYLKTFGQSAAESRSAVLEASEAYLDGGGVGWDIDRASPATPPSEGPVAVAATTRTELTAMTDRIVAAHVPGRGLHIVGTGLGTEARATTLLIEMSRALSHKGRSILVDLNRTPSKLSSMVDGDGGGQATIMMMSGLSELLAGDQSFAEVIHRDHGSRLHFIPTGRKEADFRDFDLILDALSETYDFIVLMTPAFPQSEIAKVMAPYADFVILAAGSDPDEKMVEFLEGELIEAGAREVLVAGGSARMERPAQVVA